MISTFPKGRGPAAHVSQATEVAGAVAVKRSLPADGAVFAHFDAFS